MDKGPQLFWLIQTPANLPDHEEWLSHAERAIASELRTPKRRNDWKLGRWTAKVAIRAFLSGTRQIPQLAEIEIAAAPDGAPCPLLDGRPAPVSLSLSHSLGRSLSVVTSSPISVGCDLEFIERRNVDFLPDYFSSEENQLLAMAAEPERPLVSTLIWSAKESALKLLRQGLRRDTKSVVVYLDSMRPTPGWSPLAVKCVETGRMFHGWWRTDAGFVATVASLPAAPEPIPLVP